MWFGMMAAMMLPVSVPWVRVLISLGDGQPDASRQVPRPWDRVRTGTLFLTGYLSVWLLFSLAAAALQLWLAALVPLGRDTPVAGFLLVGAGLYQLSPVKAACLRHCRSPLTWFLTRWRDGPRGTLGMGWGHGLYCLGCCWALMALALVLGRDEPGLDGRAGGGRVHRERRARGGGGRPGRRGGAGGVGGDGVGGRVRRIRLSPESWVWEPVYR